MGKSAKPGAGANNDDKFGGLDFGHHGFWQFFSHWHQGGWGHGPKQPAPSVLAPEISLTPAYQPVALLFGDQTADKVFHLRDLNGDGDANDSGERIVFLDKTNLSGLAAPTGNVFAIHQAENGAVYIAEGDTDSVYVARDLNHDGDANDAGEAKVWFSKDNAEGFQLPTPNGVSTDASGAVYVVNAGLISGQTDDAIYRTVDLNHDGDANDAGEATRWVNLQSLNVKSSAFDLSFVGDVAYLADTNGADADTIYRLEDKNHNGVIDSGEAQVFIADGNAFNAPIDFALATQDGSVVTWDFTAVGGESRVFRLSDLNNSGTIDSAGEAKEVWNTSFLPAGFGNSVGFSIAADENGDLAVTSNSGTASERNVVHLTDLNHDGDYMDAGETVIFTSNALDPDVGQRPRSVSFYHDGSAPAHPNTYHEGGNAVFFASDLTITDADSKYIGGAVIKITGGLDADHDLLSVDQARCSNIKVSYDEDTGTLTLKGLASAADYQDLLQSLQFDSRIDNPDEALRHISITVQDERGAGGGSITLSTTIAVESDAIHTVFGSDRGDYITGHNYAEQILGGGGSDVITGKNGHDRLFGEDGNDTIRGGAGNDVLSGGAGYDTLEGGKGADHFLFSSTSGTDVITDFDVFEDKIDFEGVTFKGAAIHSLADAAGAGAGHYIGHHTTVYTFDNNATLVVTEQAHIV